jgi:ClpP class serine protease
MNRRPIQPGELLAIDPKSLQRDADGIFFFFSPNIPENEYVDGVAIVHVRGPLDHHSGYGDNYDAIRERAEEAFACDEASAVIFRIDSPGGAVSGLYDTCRIIRGLAEASDKRSIAYVDEHAFSAAYAVACTCDEIVIPESGLTGSIGVISTMADQVDHDQANGFNFVTITSGERKADGHIHVRISADAVAAEEKRVEKMALQFFRMVRESRGLPITQIRGFQAGLFLGAEAEAAGVADRVQAFDELFAELCSGGDTVTHEPTDGTTLDTSGTHGSALTQEISRMRSYRAQLLEQLKTAKATLATAKGIEKTKAEVRVEVLTAQLGAYKKVTEKHVEHSKTHEEDEGDEDEEGNETDRDDDEEGDEEKDASSAKKPAKAAAKKAAKGEEEDEEEEEEEEEAMYEDEEDALVSLVERMAGPQRPKALAALHALKGAASAGQKALKAVAQMQRDRSQERFGQAISGALTERRLTKREAKALRAGNDLDGKPLAEGERGTYLRALLHSRPKAMFAGADVDLPNPIPPQRDAHGNMILPPDLQKQLDAAVMATGVDAKKVLSDYSDRSGNGAMPKE